MKNIVVKFKKYFLGIMVILTMLSHGKVYGNNGSIAPKRIRVVYHDRSKPGKVFLIPNLASTIELPCNIDDVLLGNPIGISFYISKKSSKRLELNTSQESKNTNMIIYCKNQFFVFDLVIQNKVHNDVIIFGGSFGGPELEMDPSNYQDLSGKVIQKKESNDLHEKAFWSSDKDMEKIHGTSIKLSEKDSDQRVSKSQQKTFLMTDKEALKLYRSSIKGVRQ